MRLTTLTILAALLAGPALATEAEVRNPLQDSESWQAIRGDILGEAEIADGDAVLEVDAPYRAQDAATVPVVLRQKDPSVRIERAVMVIDENPAPVAAELTFGPAMEPLDMEVRVRVDQYSNIRVIADTERGKLMSGRFVKASGGCSAPATKDPQQALANMGEMRLKQFEIESAEPAMTPARREAQIMIRHPNYSGLQRDQITQLFIAAHFIRKLEVRQGDELLFEMEGGISISENPVFRFGYNDNGAETLHVRATDTEGNVFEQELPKTGEG